MALRALYCDFCQKPAAVFKPIYLHVRIEALMLAQDKSCNAFAIFTRRLTFGDAAGENDEMLAFRFDAGSAFCGL
jgi:hypothetical protein